MPLTTGSKYYSSSDMDVGETRINLNAHVCDSSWCTFLCSSKQIDLYDETFRPIVDAVLEGYNGIA